MSKYTFFLVLVTTDPTDLYDIFIFLITSVKYRNGNSIKKQICAMRSKMLEKTPKKVWGFFSINIERLSLEMSDILFWFSQSIILLHVRNSQTRYIFHNFCSYRTSEIHHNILYRENTMILHQIIS